MPTALDLFERHHLAVYRFLRGMRLSVPDAEDLTQEVFLRVLRALPDYEERQMERAWVFRIARNAWLDRLRSHARTPVAEPLVERHVVVTLPGQIARVAIGEALAQIGETEREAFLLREVGGLGYAEIAEVTGATPDAVRSRIHRGRLALRKVLERAPSRDRATNAREA
jgi:RNA polymerase sigma-70 factor (ECF subfamily)